MLELGPPYIRFHGVDHVQKQFLIFGLPRSMTAWISTFLTCGPVFCQHELSGKLDSPEEIADSIRQQPFPFSGLADPGALMIWRELTELLPDAQLIYISRNSSDSQRKLTDVAGVDQWRLSERYDLLNQRAADFRHHCKPKVVQFDDLTTEHWLRTLWSWCAGESVLLEPHLRKMMTLRVTQKDEIIQSAANRPQTKGAFKW